MKILDDRDVYGSRVVQGARGAISVMRLLSARCHEVRVHERGRPVLVKKISDSDDFLRLTDTINVLVARANK